MSIATATLVDRIVPRTRVNDVALIFSGAALTRSRLRSRFRCIRSP